VCAARLVLRGAMVERAAVGRADGAAADAQSGAAGAGAPGARREAGVCLQVGEALLGSGPQRCKEGVLLLARQPARRVAVLLRRGNGDVLVQDGARLFVVPARAVELAVREIVPQEEEEPSEGSRWLALVRAAQARLQSCDADELSLEWLQSEARRSGLTL
jgi:hypothetical protein